jgi:tripartite-type tricarboxylate transporter receptor subunit TctC
LEETMMLRRSCSAMLAIVLAGLCSPIARADPVEDFYKGRTIFLQIGSAPGGIYDIVGRMFARHMGRFIPGNPKLVPQNVPGGGSLNLANQFGNIAPHDGSVFGVFNNGMPMTPLLTPAAAHYDPRKFNYLGSPSRETHILIAWKTSPVTTMADTFTKEMIVGATSPGAAPYDFPAVTNALIGTRFKIVTGYPGGQETKLAMARGEIHGNPGLALSSFKTDYADSINDVVIVAIFGLKPSPELPNVPVFPLGKTAEDRQLFELLYARQAYGRPFLTPPDVPAERVKALRVAFEATMKDAEFLAEAKKTNVDIDPVSADELTQLTEAMFKTSPAVVERIQKLLDAK